MTGDPWPYLESLCFLAGAPGSRSSFCPLPDPLSAPRVSCIRDILLGMGVEPEVDLFGESGDGSGDPGYVNLCVRFRPPGPVEGHVLLIAHHDVADPELENCLDNSSSVANLLALCDRFRVDLPRGVEVHVLFSDAEETCCPVVSGALRYAGRMLGGLPDGESLLSVCNLELTAVGRPWRALYSGEVGGIGMFPDAEVLSCPPNDMLMLSRHLGVSGICLGLLPGEDLLSGGRRLWSLCHTSGDVIGNAAREDMLVFCDALEREVREVLERVPDRGCLPDPGLAGGCVCPGG